ncbi:hypothetical protein B0H14DRAFT_2851492 [Mycena olivaceomarginata]|nr:hypothetical protein B0H14DRAFT_2851492 [Mycena olivaceomarginata]
MGNTQSIFFPDNPNRLRRAQQLADDCKYAQDQYDSAKKQLEATLGPYKEKLDKLLKAFGCNNIDDLDRLILSTATGDTLARWNRTKETYDASLIVDQVIMAAEGIVTVVGLTVSIIGALAGGIGFFAGIGVTADILLVLGLIGAVYDIINGAIQREKLQESINFTFPTRIKAKYNQMQMDQLLKSLPAVQAVYQACEELGYDKDKILQKFKDKKFLDSLKTETSNITYYNAAQELADMDSRRGSWTNEDPDWRSLAGQFDAERSAVPATPFVNFGTTSFIAPENVENNIDDVPPPYDGHILIQFAKNEVSPVLSSIFHVILEDFPSHTEARVRVNTKDDKEALVADVGANSVKLIPSDSAGTASTAAGFSIYRDADLSRRPNSVAIQMHIDGLYLTREGSLTPDKDLQLTLLMTSYA